MSEKVKVWHKRTDGYSLSIEYSPDWFADIYRYDGRWHYRIGTRIKEGEQQKIYTSKRGFMSPSSVKEKALRSIRHLQANQ